MSMTNDEADAAYQLNKGVDTAHTYLRMANESINELYGQGYAYENPELIGRFMMVAQMNLSSYIIAAKLQEIIYAMDRLGASVRGQ